MKHAAGGSFSCAWATHGGGMNALLRLGATHFLLAALVAGALDGRITP